MRRKSLSLATSFDFWYEYRKVVQGIRWDPRKLAELTDSGIPIQFLWAITIMWMKDYFKHETEYSRLSPTGSLLTATERNSLIGHAGDGLAPRSWV